MKLSRILVVAALAATASCASGGRASSDQAARTKPEPKQDSERVTAQPETPEEPTPGELDKGTFAIYVGEDRVGEELMEIARDESGNFVLRSELELTIGQDSFSATSALELDESWRPRSGRSVVTTSEGDEVSVVLASVDGRLEEKTKIGDAPADTVRASEQIDLYLGEAAVSFAAPLCRSEWPQSQEIVVFPDLTLPLERADWAMVPPDDEGKTPSALTLVLLDAESQDPLIALCEEQQLVLVWLPAINLAAGRDSYEEIASELAAEQQTMERSAQLSSPRESSLNGL